MLLYGNCDVIVIQIMCRSIIIFKLCTPLNKCNDLINIDKYCQI